MNLLWLLRAKRWAKHPPSLTKALAILGVIAVCVAIYAIEKWFGGGGGSITNWRRPNF